MKICEVCGKPKETHVVIPELSFDRMMPCPCDCDKSERSKADAEKLKREISYHKREAHIPKKYQDCYFSKSDGIDKRVYNYVEHFKELKDNGAGLLLYGNVGTGKTYHAACIANELLNQGYRVRITTIQEMYDRYASSMFKRPSMGLMGPREFTSFDLVIIDDIGTQRKTEMMNEVAYNTINKLYAEKIPMILTTNVNVSELDPRIVDRIKEVCVPVKFDGKSKRTSSDTVKNALNILNSH